MINSIAFLLLFQQFYNICGLYTINTYPNPQTDDGFVECRFTRRTLFCDPDFFYQHGSERESILAMVDKFSNDTKSSLPTSDCERKGTTLAIALINGQTFQLPNSWNSSTSLEMTKKLADKWMPPMVGECRKIIMVMLFVPLKFVRLSSIYTTKGTLLHEHEISILLDMVENQISTNGEAVYSGIVLLIDQLKKVLVNRREAVYYMSLYYNALQEKLELLQNGLDEQLKSQSGFKEQLEMLQVEQSGLISFWVCVGIAVSCSILVAISIFAVYWAVFLKKYKNFDGPISFSQLSQMELQGQSNYNDNASAGTVESKSKRMQK